MTSAMLRYSRSLESINFIIGGQRGSEMRRVRGMSQVLIAILVIGETTN